MKVKALANLSGKPGKHAKGATFEVDDAYGAELIARKLVATVTAESVPAAAPKARRAAKKI